MCMNKNLFPIERTKRKATCICAKCDKDILVGEKYMSVQYNDTYTCKWYGAFHVECWKNFSNAS
jgi:hypothetical protein